MQNIKVNTRSCQFVGVSDILPKGWAGWFYELLSEVSDLCWGTNCLSLVNAFRFGLLCEEVIEINRSEDPNDESVIQMDKDAQELRRVLSYLDANFIYIDMEG